MNKMQKSSAPFYLEGRFLGYDVEDGYKIKRLHLATATGEQTVKLSKEARVSLGRVLVPGEWIAVRGMVKRDRETGQEKFKAVAIQPMPPQKALAADAMPTSQGRAAASQAAPAPRKPQTILMCQKSDCMKRGGKQLCPALQAELRDRGLADQVTIRGTGCMKQCKAGPNLIMPDKTRYTRLTAAEVPALLDHHFPASKAGASLAGAIGG